MSERKNIKRNSTRVSASERPFHQSMQRNYKSGSGKKKGKPEKITLSGLKLFYPETWEKKVEELRAQGVLIHTTE